MAATDTAKSDRPVQTHAERQEHAPPYAAYAKIVGTFAGGLVAAGAVARMLDRDLESSNALDFVILSAASFKASRTVTRDKVASFMREPFVEGEATEGHEEPIQDGGMQQAIGELVTCTRCAGTWAAAGLASAQIIAPRFGRLLTWSLGAAAANDFLQAAFVALTTKSNEITDRVEDD